MSEFKFTCPGCHQRISVTHEYIGHQINCPSCKALITVPAPPTAAVHAPPAAAAPAPPVRSSIALPVPPGTPPPPAPPAVTKLGVSALNAKKGGTAASSHAPNPMEQTGSAQYQAFKASQAKKSYTGVIVGVCAVVLIGVSALLNKDRIVNEWHSLHGTPAVAAVETNEPPPTPPELTVDEIWQKVAATYKALNGYSGAGNAVLQIDYSQVNRALAAGGPRPVSDDLALKMSRPGSFRLDLVDRSDTNGRVYVGWSAGQGDFLQINTNRSRLPAAFPVFTSLNRLGAGLGGALVTALFFNQSDNVPIGGDWTRDDDQTLNGKTYYQLSGSLFLRNAKLWVDRSTFLISVIQFTLDGKIMDDNNLDDAKLKSALTASGVAPVTPADVTQFKRLLKNQSKLKGTITVFFSDATPNATLAQTDFEPPAVMTASAVQTAAPAAGPPGRGNGGSGPGGVPGRMRRAGGAPPPPPPADGT